MPNREQARRAAKERKRITIPNPTPNELKLRLYENEREKKLVQRIVHDMNIVILMIAHDKLHFGKKRLTRLYNFLVETWDSVEQKYVSIEDMETALIDEVGIEFFQMKL